MMTNPTEPIERVTCEAYISDERKACGQPAKFRAVWQDASTPLCQACALQASKDPNYRHLKMVLLYPRTV